MVFWQRLLFTVIAMLAASFLAELLWHAIFERGMPSYLAGMVGGFTALPVWHLLGLIKPKGKATPEV